MIGMRWLNKMPSWRSTNEREPMMPKAITKRPAWSSSIKAGDLLTVRAEYMTRGGQQGEVLYVNDEGVGLDFNCDSDGDPDSVPSQEFWNWEEIDPDLLPLRQ